eukprot:5203247-Prorocentrum_lima.AAC.1
MTSSLVGSEMCIRDSDITIEEEVSTLVFWGMVVEVVDGNLMMHQRPYLETVSYTHLTLPTICSV